MSIDRFFKYIFYTCVRLSANQLSTQITIFLYNSNRSEVHLLPSDKG